MNKLSLGFAMISGLGWLFDFTTMSFMVQLGIEPGIANFFSASVAASLVYWASRKLLFRKSFGLSATGGFIFYLLYTSVAVIIFSYLIQLLSSILHDYSNDHGYDYSLVLIAIIVKVIVTPFNLLTNYIVSCKLAKKF